MLEFLGWFVTTVDDISHVRSQNEWCTVPFEITKHLCITEEFPEINMEKVARGFDHNIIIMSITNAENVGGHAIAGAGSREIVHGSLVFER